MSVPRSKTGLLRYNDGHIELARFYYGDHEEAPPSRVRIDSARYATWIEDDGTVGIRQGTSAAVGASAAYSTNYNALDWGN
jgi:hypothetical protein